MGWNGMDEWDGTVHQKGPLIFFILRFIKHYTYTYYIYIYILYSDKLFVGLKFGQVGELPQRFSKSHFRRRFFQKWLLTSRS